MKNKNYLLIGFVGIVLVAGTWFVSLSADSSLPDTGMKNKPENQATHIIQDDKQIKSPLPDRVKRLKENDSVKFSGGTGDGTVRENSTMISDEKADKAAAESDRDIVDKELLRKEFPDKIHLFPITEEEIEARKHVVFKKYEQLKQILANQATEEEVNAFYDEKNKLTEDRMEIIQFSISEFGDHFSEDGMNRHKNTLMILEEQLGKIPKKRKRAIMRLKSQENRNEDS